MSKVIIGTTLFVVLICSGYSATNIIEQPTNVTNKQEVNIGKIEYRGQFLMPVENLIKVTSKYGGRKHPITRNRKFSYRNRFSRSRR